MKKLLILGAMEMHVPLIKRAKELGIYTITCDYLPENPGHKIADEAYFDSTTDINAVLELSQKLKIDGIMTYNSDPAAPTASYVAEKLHLPGNPYISVKTMSEKDLFRNFLKEKKLNYPKFHEFTTFEESKDYLSNNDFPIIIKPVDSSGSKGCTVLYDCKGLLNAVNKALEKSRCKRFIIEEYIDTIGHQLHGDGFVKNGKLIFLCLGDHHFDSNINNLVPYSTTYPSEHSDLEIEQCKKEVQLFIEKVGFCNGGINVELRISKKTRKPYIIDIGARNGGNFNPKVIQYATEFNFLDSALAVALGNTMPSNNVKNNGFYSYLILHSYKSGVIESITIDKLILERVIESHIYLKNGDFVESFIGANAAIGVLIMKYENLDIMNEIVNNFENLYSVNIKENS